MAHSPRFYEILINHTPPGGFVTKRIMRGCHVASWHKVGAAPSGWVISCIIRVKSLNEWHVGKAHLVTVKTIGSSVIVLCLLSLLCLLNVPVVDVNGACILMLIQTSADSFFLS